MEFSWTEEQADLRAAVRRVLESKAPVSRARELAEAGERHDPGLWKTLATQLGLQGLLVPEELGGSGATPVEMAVVMEEMGAVLHGGPFLPTAVLSVAALLELGDDEHTVDVLGRIAEGGATATLAAVEADGRWAEASIRTTAEATAGGATLTGEKHLVLDGADADVLLVLARAGEGLGWYAVEPGAEGLDRVPRRTLDATRPMASVRFRGTPARPLGRPGDGWRVARQVQARGSVLLAAEQAGAAGELVRRTAEYATTRRQFGRPIGTFQGVKHRLSDMEVRYELARSAAYWAAWQDPASDEARQGALIARSWCSDSLLQTAKDTIQLHGGIGFTWEHDAHLYLRRARADAALLGSAAEARAALLPLVLEGATR